MPGHGLSHSGYRHLRLANMKLWNPLFRTKSREWGDWISCFFAFADGNAEGWVGIVGVME